MSKFFYSAFVFEQNFAREIQWKWVLTRSKRLLSDLTTNLGRGRFWRPGLTSAERRRMVLRAPLWARQFQAAYGSGRSSLPWPSGLLNAIAPLADAPRRRVRAAIAASPVTPRRFDSRDALVQDLERALFNRLFLAASPTLVVELGVAREHGLLAGDSPEDRFGFFCDCLCDKVFAAGLLAQYPTLVRRLVGLAAKWESTTLETLSRLTADLDLPAFRRLIFIPGGPKWPRQGTIEAEVEPQRSDLM